MTRTLFLVALCMPKFAHAVDLYVCATPGICSLDAECIANPGSCFSSVTAAMDAGQADDIVWLSAEIYVENLVHHGGASPLTIIGDPVGGGTVLDGNATGDALNFRDVDITLIDVSITVTAGADRRCLKSDGGSLTLERVTVEGCLKDKGAGLEAKNGTEVLISDSVFSNNVSDGNAKGGGHLLVSTASSVTIEDSRFETGQATGVNAVGGAIHVEDGTLDVAGTVFTSNQSTSSGGAVYIENAGHAVFTVSDFDLNSGVVGGALRIDGDLAVVGGTFSANMAEDGGALYCGVGASCSVVQATFDQNTAIRGAGLMSDQALGLEVLNTLFCQNASAAQGGAGVIVDSAATVLYSVFVENTAVAQGAGLYVGDGATVQVVNNHFVGNDSAGVGGALYVEASTVDVRNDLFLSNTSPNSEVVYEQGGSAVIDFSLFWEWKCEFVVSVVFFL